MHLAPVTTRGSKCAVLLFFRWCLRLRTTEKAASMLGYLPQFNLRQDVNGGPHPNRADGRGLRVMALVSALAGAAWWLRPRHSSWIDPGPSTPSTPLALRVSGHGDVPVLLLHGLVGSSRFWSAGYDHLGDNCRVMAVDLLGFGRSPRPEHGYDLDHHVDAILSTLDQLGMDNAVVIGAHSLGAVLAVALAARTPERVAGIVMFGPAIYPSPTQARTSIKASGAMSRLIALDTPLAATLCAWTCAHRSWAARLARIMRPELPAEVARDSVQHNWASYSGTMRNVIIDTNSAQLVTDAINAMTLIEPTGAVRPKMLMKIILGNRDKVSYRPTLERLATASSRLAIETWHGGHDLPIRHPKKCIAALVAMIEETHPDRAGHPQPEHGYAVDMATDI